MGSGSLWLRLLQAWFLCVKTERLPQLSQASSALEKPWETPKEINQCSRGKLSSLYICMKLVSQHVKSGIKSRHGV